MDKTGQESLVEQVRKWNWLGYILLLRNDDTISKHALTVDITRPQKKRATKNTWRRDLESQIGTVSTVGGRWRCWLKTELDGEK